MLTTDQILAQTTMPEAVVPVPEWGGEVRVRALTKAKAQELRKTATVAKWVNGQMSEEFDGDRFELALFAAGVCEPAFTADQVAQLGALAAGPVTRVTQEILKVSGLTKDGHTSQEAVDNAQKSVSQDAALGE